ncbi:MAG: YbhN family protein [Actinomycetota bacterium]
MTAETPPDTVPDKPKFGKQQIIATILTLLILIMVFVIVLPQFGDYGEAWIAIQNMESWQLGLIVLATIALIIIYVTPYLAALPGLRFKPAFYTRQTSFMISNVIPGGGAWGLAVQYGMLSSYGYGPAPTTATIGITSVWNTLVTLSLPVVALVGLAASGQSNDQAVAATAIAAVAVITMIVVFALILRSEVFARKIGRLGDRIIGWGAGLIRKDIDVDAEAGVVSFRDSIVDVVTDRWLLITLANVGQQLAQFSILYLAVVALQGGSDGPITLVEAFAAFSFGRLATFIPVPPGGLGTTDAIITASLTTFGLPNNDALAATMVWRAATYFPQVIIGVITMLLWRRKRPSEAVAR